MQYGVETVLWYDDPEDHRKTTRKQSRVVFNTYKQAWQWYDHLINPARPVNDALRVTAKIQVNVRNIWVDCDDLQSFKRELDGAYSRWQFDEEDAMTTPPKKAPLPSVFKPKPFVS